MTKKKNVFLQGRQRVHNEWAEADSPRYRKFIADNKAKFDKDPVFVKALSYIKKNNTNI